MENNPVQFDFSKAVPVNSTAQAQSDSGNGVTLDFSKAQPVDHSTSDQQSQVTSPVQNDSLLEQTGEALGNAVIGVGKSALGTVAGTDEWARKHLPAFFTNSNFGFGPPADLEQQKQLMTTHGTAQSVGAGVETLGEFLLGDEALKGLALSERFVRASKAAKVIEESPLLTRVVNAGVRALRGATVGGTQAGLKTGDANDAATAAVAGGVGNAVIPEAVDAVQTARKALPGALDTIRTVIKPGTIQDAFQRQIREIINSAANDLGVNTSSAPSIRDVGQEVSNNLLQRARQSYQALDEATGGRVQRFSDAIKAVQQKLRNLNGIQTPDDEGKWIERLNELTDAHENAMQEAESQGVPRTLLNKANADFKSSKAMLDLSRHIRMSTEGLRPSLRMVRRLQSRRRSTLGN